MINILENVCVVILNFNQNRELIIGLERLAESTYLPEKIIIFDNNSNEKFGYEVFDCFKDDIKQEIFYNSINEGAGGGWHNVIKLAYEQGFEWIITCDADGWFKKDTIEKLWKNREKGELLSSIQLSPKDNSIMTHGLKRNLDSYFSKGSKDLSEIRKWAKDKIIFNTGNPWTGTMIKRSFIDDLGLPEKKYFIQGEETEYFIRGVKNKKTVITLINCFTEHPIGEYKKNIDVIKKYTYFNVKHYFSIYHQHYGFFIATVYFFKQVFKSLTQERRRYITVIFKSIKHYYSDYWPKSIDEINLILK